MPRRVLAANIGLSDLYCDVASPGEPPDFCNLTAPEVGAVGAFLGTERVAAAAVALGRAPGACAVARVLRDDLDTVAARVCYPLLRPVLLTLTAERPLDLLVLIGTDQPDRRANQHDTIESARVLKALIARDFGARGQLRRGGVAQIAIEVCAVQPNRDELVFPVMREILERAAPATPDLEFHAEVSGGTSALRQALIGQAQLLYGTRSHLYNLSYAKSERPRRDMPDSAIDAIPPKVNPLLHEAIRDSVRVLLDGDDYGGALRVLRQFAVVRFWGEPVDLALQHAARRANFDYVGATRILQKNNTHLGKPFSNWYAATQQATLFGKLVDTAALAERYYQGAEYADMLWRTASFYENGLRLTAHLLLPDLGLDTATYLPEAVVARHDGLARLLRDQGARRRRNQRDWEAERGTFSVICLYALGDGQLSALATPTQRGCQQARDLLQSLDSLYSLRNDLIHHFDGVTAGTLDANFRADHLIHGRPQPGHRQGDHQFIVPTLRQILAALQPHVGSGPLRADDDHFREIRAFVLMHLRGVPATND